MKVIYEQDYDLVDIIDIIEDSQFEEFCKWFYEYKITHINKSCINEIYDITYHPNYTDFLGPRVTWKYDLKLKSIGKLSDSWKEQTTKYPTSYKDREEHFGFQYANFEGINTFKQMKNINLNK